MDNNELYHYGVPGMKWGQRRASKKRPTTSKQKTNVSRNTKIAIGASAASLALIGIGAMTLNNSKIASYRNTSLVKKALFENL